MPDPDPAALRAALDRIRPLVRAHPWFKSCGIGVPPDPPDAPVGIRIDYVAPAPDAEATIRRYAAEVAPGLPVYAVPGGRAARHDAGRPG